MKIRTICWAALLMVIGSMLAAQPAFAQVPCGPTISPLPTLFVNWPQFGYDPRHSSCNPYEFILSPATVGNLVLDWTYQTGFGCVSSCAFLARGGQWGGLCRL
jgi:hypothetical protein